jgi:hypothetical protein
MQSCVWVLRPLLGGHVRSGGQSASVVCVLEPPRLILELELGATLVAF